MDSKITYNDYNEVTKALNDYHISCDSLTQIFSTSKLMGIDLSDCLSKGQLISKYTLINLLGEVYTGTDLSDKLNCLLCGGWYGILAIGILDKYKNMYVDSCDIDPSCESVANAMNYRSFSIDKTFKAFTADMYNVDYSKYQIVVNTSTEHIRSLKTWLSLIPYGATVVMQNNNNKGYAGHINCKSSMQEFKNEAELSGFTVLNSLELVLPDYTRYTIICKR